MRDGKNVRIYSVLGLAGMAIGAIVLSRRRRRSNALGEDRQPEGKQSRDATREPPGRAEHGNAPIQGYVALPDTNRDIPAVVVTTRPDPPSEPGDQFPASVPPREPVREEALKPEPQIVPLETKASETPELARVSSSMAAGQRTHQWIQTGCAVLAVFLIVFFGVRLSRRLQALTEAQHGSESATVASQELTRTEQRAWVGMMEAVPLPLRPDGGGFTIKVQNTGKTPAVDVRLSAVIGFADNESLNEAEIPNAGLVTPLGTLLPGAAYTTDVLFRTSPAAVRALANHQHRAVGLLWISYTDVFKTSHSSRTCFYWYSDLKAVKPCEAFNEMK